MKPSRDIIRLIEIMAALRTPGSGCPWDLEQTFESIAPYTIEEAHEVADAIDRGDMADIRDELGDLLLQVAFHARMAEEAGSFDFGDVVQAITEKLIRRHPHVFGDAKDLSADEVAGLWQRIKAQEKAARPDKAAPTGVLSGVPGTLPALMRAEKLQAKAAGVGFDWGALAPVLDKVREELAEVAEAAASGRRNEIAGEVGDLLFAAVNAARFLGVEPEGALRAANRKFERRFAAVEAGLAARGKAPHESTLEEMDALWDAAKRAERGGMDGQD